VATPAQRALSDGTSRTSLSQGNSVRTVRSDAFTAFSWPHRAGLDDNNSTRGDLRVASRRLMEHQITLPGGRCTIRGNRALRRTPAKASINDC
jgi:hypothetical protein